MPDTRLTFRSIVQRIAANKWYFIIGLALVVALSELIFAVTAPRTPESQIVHIEMIAPYAYSEPLTPVAEAVLADVQAEFPDMKEVLFMPLAYTGDANDTTGAMLFTLRVQAGNIDVFFANAEVMQELFGAGMLMELGEYFAELEPLTFDGRVYARSMDTLNGFTAIQAYPNAGMYLAVAESDDSDAVLAALGRIIELML